MSLLLWLARNTEIFAEFTNEQLGEIFCACLQKIYVCCFCFKMLHLANAVAVWLYGRMVDRYVKDETLFAKAQRY